MGMERLQAALRLIYPPRCLTCDAAVVSDFGLCPTCWRDTVFIGGMVCDACGTPLPGDDDTEVAHCDDCMTIARPWSRGRAALIYGGNARRIVLALKHGDRQDLARPAARWMARAANPILIPGMLIVPIPLHWTRLLRRRYNQAALLANALARETGLECHPDLLVRTRRTRSQDGRGRDARFANLDGVIHPHPRRGTRMAGQKVLLIDDVMTSGATLAAATDACLRAGATNVCILTLARVAKDT